MSQAPPPLVDWPLLKKVSRSFYLTLRLLPRPVRESIALAYLLARFTDTKADGATTDAEVELLRREDSLRHALEASPDRKEIETVWQTIQQGQAWDLERFARSPQGAPAPPLNEEELDRYTYLVAGCVGEFWTVLCAKNLPNFSRLPIEQMTALGIQFGQGLQMVNILRDLASDLRLGRVYVPKDRVPETFVLARQHLDAAEKYVHALYMRRVRAACALPLLLGRETLDLITASPQAAHVKVSRAHVWALLGRSLVY